MSRKPVWIVFSLATSLAVTHAAHAVTIRHDRADSQYLALGADARYASVGYIEGVGVDSSNQTFSYSASAVLIGNNWALTAGHVVDQATSLTFQLNGTTFTAASWVANPSWDGSLNRGYDIGLIKFNTDLAAATGVAPATRYTGTGEVGALGTFVGYGMTGTGLTGSVTFDGLKRGAQNAIDALLNTGGRTSRTLLADFDNPNGSSSDNNWGSATPVNLEGLIGPGDSGGGLFIDVNAGGTPTTYLAGIHSFGWGRLDGDPDDDYGDASGHTRVSQFNSWIDSVMSGKTGGKGGGRKTTSNGAMLVHVNGDNGHAAVPEPATAGLTLMGLAALLMRRRR